MKYRVNRTYKDGSFEVITEDGGVAAVHHNGSNYVTTYYGVRLTDCDINNYIWDELSKDKTYFKDWEGDDALEIDMILDALEWLVFPSPQEEWEQDDTIWTEFFPPRDMRQCLIDSLSDSHWFAYNDENIDAFKDAIENIAFGLEQILDKKILKDPDHCDAVDDALILVKTIMVHV